jgi:hypothetical protein
VPDARASERIENLPKGVGAVLLVTGMVTGMLPPPPGPFDISLMLVGGTALWPGGFGTLEGWVQRRFPSVHRSGTKLLRRLVDDMERRYPGPAQ